MGDKTAKFVKKTEKKIMKLILQGVNVKVVFTFVSLILASI